LSVDGPRLLLIDNYDSFTWNLAQGLGAAGAAVDVVQNDAETVDQLCARRVDGLVVSPGPGEPTAAGITVAVLRAWPATSPVLGVCLGHQALAMAFGARLRAAPAIRHGKTSPIVHTGVGVFAGVPSPCAGMRYHSLVIDPATLSPDFEVTARATDDGSVMAIRHRRRPWEGVQFHPESVGTPDGANLLANFVGMVRGCRQRSAA
jgi:anthranilate synthase/aminodeoxychorismate synthase-like glutamine amidotransferase